MTHWQNFYHDASSEELDDLCSRHKMSQMKTIETRTVCLSDFQFAHEVEDWINADVFSVLSKNGVSVSPAEKPAIKTNPKIGEIISWYSTWINSSIKPGEAKVDFVYRSETEPWLVGFNILIP